MTEPSTDEREALVFIQRWVERYAEPGGDRRILLTKIGIVTDALAARPAVDVEGIARAVAAAQSVPFVGPKQRKIAQAVVAYLAGEGR